MDTSAGGGDRGDEPRDLAENVLTVVQHQERIEGSDRRDQIRLRVTGFLEPGVASEHVRDRIGIADRRQPDGNHAVRVDVTPERGDVASERRLAHPTWPDQRDERPDIEQFVDRSDVVVAAEQRRPRRPRPRFWGIGGLVRATDRGDEAVPATAEVLDDGLSGAVVADSTANLLDPRGERRLRHELISPHFVEQLGLRDDTVPVGQ